jgi:NADPH:quinone reductase-like Zn-dependent oxidoreductase
VWTQPDPSDLNALAALADAGELMVPIERALPLAEAIEALRLSQTGRVRGKIVLDVS